MDDLAAVRKFLCERRRDGVPFEKAWQAALAALEPLPKNYSAGMERDAALSALTATAPAWEAAYVGQPAPRRERAAARLQSLVAEPF